MAWQECAVRASGPGAEEREGFKTTTGRRVGRGLRLAAAFALAPVIAVVILVALLDAPAEASVMNGCKYPGTNPTIQYRYYSVASAYRTANYQARLAWNATSAPGSFAYTNGSDPEIKVYDGWYGEDNNAWVAGGCDSGYFKPWYNDLTKLFYNRSNMDSMSANRKKLTAIHELGHTYGLAHDGSVNCWWAKAVMYSDAGWVANTCGDWNAPYPDDVTGVGYIY